MDMKKLVVMIIALAMALPAMSQQLPLFSLYRENSFILNPAIAGSEDHAIASFTYREQWTSMADRPRTSSVNFHSPIYRYNFGLGGQIIYDRTGPTSLTGATFTYAYHIKFYKLNPFRFPTWVRNSVLSFGLSASIYQYRLETTDLILDQPNDLAVSSEDNNAILPNAGVGIYYYYDNFFLGYSSPQLIPLNSKFTGDDGVSIIQRVNHNFIVAGGKIPFGRKEGYRYMFSFMPVVWFKHVKNAPWQLDGHARLMYWDYVWVGAGYRTSNALVVEVGGMIRDRIKIGYAYDQQIGELSSQLGGAHEIMVAYHFAEPKKFGRGPTRKRKKKNRHTL